jgi:hypothetical protein
VTLEHLTLEQILTAGGVSAGLLMVRTFCWCWRQRSQRKTTLAVLDKLGEANPALVREPEWPLAMTAASTSPDN